MSTHQFNDTLKTLVQNMLAQKDFTDPRVVFPGTFGMAGDSSSNSGSGSGNGGYTPAPRPLGNYGFSGGEHSFFPNPINYTPPTPTPALPPQVAPVSAGIGSVLNPDNLTQQQKAALPGFGGQGGANQDGGISAGLKGSDSFTDTQEATAANFGAAGKAGFGIASSFVDPISAVGAFMMNAFNGILGKPTPENLLSITAAIENTANNISNAVNAPTAEQAAINNALAQKAMFQTRNNRSNADDTFGPNPATGSFSYGAEPGGAGAPSGTSGGGPDSEAGHDGSPGNAGAGSNAAGLAKGGYVHQRMLGADPDGRGPETGTVGIQSGEYVLNRETVKRLGPALLDLINKQGQGGIASTLQNRV